MNVRQVFIVAVIAIFVSHTHAQTNWLWKNPTPQGNVLRSLFVKADTFGIAVGDVGITLTRSKSAFLSPVYPVTSTLRGICYNKDTSWVVGDGGVIYRSLDNGVTWSSQSYTSVSKVNFHTCYALSKSNLWVAGDSGIILYSTDRGENWTKQTNTNKRTINSIANGSPRPNVYCACDSGIILEALNYGLGGFFPVANKHKFNFHSVAMNSTEIFFVGDSGYILQRDALGDSTLTDTLMDNGANAFYDVGLASPFVVVVGANGAIKVSNDDGTTWSSPPSNVTEKLYKVGLSANFATSGVAWAVGENGVFLKTIDSGKTWARLDTGVRGTVYAAGRSPNGDLYATSLVGKSYRLLNGKSLWTLDSLKAGGAPRLTDIAFDKNGFGLLATYDIIALRTADSGRTWTNVTVNANAVQVLGVATWTTLGLACASNGVVYRSTNKGLAWSATVTNNTQPLYDVDVSGNNAIAVGFNGLVLYSVDGGQTWKKPASSGTNSLLNKVRFFTTTNAVAVSSNGVIIRTLDGGVTWTVVVSGVTTPLNDVAFHDDKNGIIVGDGGIILKTNDGGKTWTKDQSNTSYDLKGAIIVDGTTALVAGSKTTILSTSNSGLPVNLLSFAGHRLSNAKVLLNWSVANETDNYGYTVEKLSSPSAIWNTVGFVSGAGSTSTQHAYSLLDEQSSTAGLTYRLLQTDLDGSEHDLGIVEIAPSAVTNDESVSLNPNPSHGLVQLGFTLDQSENARISLLNELGVEIKLIANSIYEAGRHTLEFVTEGVPAGSYRLRIVTPSRTKLKQLVIVK